MAGAGIWELGGAEAKMWRPGIVSSHSSSCTLGKEASRTLYAPRTGNLGIGTVQNSIGGHDWAVSNTRLASSLPQ
jgi:hypothetical protein